MNPVVFEIDETDETGVVGQLEKVVGDDGELGGRRLQFPAVFIGGELFWRVGSDYGYAYHWRVDSGVEKSWGVMALNISTSFDY